MVSNHSSLMEYVNQAAEQDTVGAAAAVAAQEQSLSIVTA